MQIFKPFLLACSLAVATSPVCLRADDTDAQAAARAALQQKMREMNGQAPAAVRPSRGARGIAAENAGDERSSPGSRAATGRHAARRPN